VADDGFVPIEGARFKDSDTTPTTTATRSAAAMTAGLGVRERIRHPSQRRPPICWVASTRSRVA